MFKEIKNQISREIIHNKLFRFLYKVWQKLINSNYFNKRLSGPMARLSLSLPSERAAFTLTAGHFLFKAPIKPGTAWRSFRRSLRTPIVRR